MNNLFQKFILINFLIISIFPLFFQDLLNIWFFIEINNFLFIYLICIQLNNKKLIFFYFLIQIISSLLIILPLIFNNFFLFINIKWLIINFYTSIIIKLGIPPFHIWIPYVSKFINWKIILIFLTIQKIIPFYLISLIEINLLILNYFILLTSVISTYKIINLLNIKILIIYSSINQTRWILLLIYFKISFWLIYITIYTLILYIIFSFFSFFKFNLNFYLNKNLNLNLIYLILILNLARIPPLPFFLIKWINLFISIFNRNFHLIFILIIINSFILIYIYINIFTLILFFNIIKFKFFNYSIILLNKNYFFILLNFLNFFISLFIIFI